MNRSLKFCAGPMTVLSLAATAGAEQFLPASSTDAAGAAAWLSNEPPLLDTEQLTALLTSSESTALATFSNLPMIGAAAFDESAQDAAGDRWVIGLNISGFVPGIVGDVSVQGDSIHFNDSFFDILDSTDSVLGLTGLLRVSKGKIGGYVGGTYAKATVEAGPVGEDEMTFTFGLISFGVTYEIGRWSMESTATDDRPARDITLLLTAGGRYTSLDLDIDFAIDPDASADRSWVDPMVGGVLCVPISQHFSIVGAGEIGGFGLASDLAWAASIVISWDFHLGKFPSSLQFGYLAIGDKYETDSGLERFEWNTIMHGFLVNFNIRF